MKSSTRVTVFAGSEKYQYDILPYARDTMNDVRDIAYSENIKTPGLSAIYVRFFNKAEECLYNRVYGIDWGDDL